jgi:hypothetical protein
MVLRTPTIVLAKVTAIRRSLEPPLDPLFNPAYLLNPIVDPNPDNLIPFYFSPLEASLFLAMSYTRPPRFMPPSSSRTTTAKFETVKAVRGNPPSRFSLRAIAPEYSRVGFETRRYFAFPWMSSSELPPPDDESPGNFSGHRDPGFWRDFGWNSLRNTYFEGDCRFYGMFKVGEQYLVFLDGPSYPRSYENVKSEDDLWYLTVVDVINTLKALEGP